ncbi:MAG: tyrosine-protein kinase family protein [Desulfobacteraceae bacterium]|jgi:Mrp family chromosome partitioning ATPase|nr:MAG: tyrosine-protein kinase family protein [Desulfobacteraceae bacterium]
MGHSESRKAKAFSELAEANRIMTGLEARAQEEFAGRGIESPCYMVTSAEAGEGKTMFTAGLARAAARRGGRRILAVDLNWYRPGLHKCFDVEPEWRFSDYEKQGKPDGFIRESGEDGLDILTAPVSGGNGESPTAVSSARAADILREARAGYDIVFVDTGALFPPNRNMLDPVFIGRACDAAVMVTLANVTARQQVKRAQMMLESAGVRVHGVVFNNWKNTVC